MKSLNVSLRDAQNTDRSFIERVFFETQRWIIEELFGWRGEGVERLKFAEGYDERNTKVIAVDGEDCGWLTVQRDANRIELNSIFITSTRQRQGIGTMLITELIAEAVASGVPLTLSTAKINPARSLYERLGFAVVNEETYKVYLRFESSA